MYNLSCSVIEVDSTGPVISDCPQSAEYVVPPGTTSQQVTWTEPTAVDDSGQPAVVTQSHRPDDSFPIGSTEVSYTFTDQTGNSNNCIFIITIMGMFKLY